MLLRRPSEKIPLLFSGPVSPRIPFSDFGRELWRELEFLRENPCSLETGRICPLNFILLFSPERRFSVLTGTIRFEDWLQAAAVRTAQFLAGIGNLISDEQRNSLPHFPVVSHASGLAEFAETVFRHGTAPLALLTGPVVFRNALLLNFIARGSTSAVYRIEWNGELCALKQALPGAEERFRREIALFPELEHHPNFPRLRRFFSGNEPCCVMELCRTGRLVGDYPRFRPGFMNALHFLHRRGILHGDIRRSNLGISACGKPVLMDFSHAKKLDEREKRDFEFQMETEKLKCLLA